MDSDDGALHINQIVFAQQHILSREESSHEQSSNVAMRRQ